MPCFSEDINLDSDDEKESKMKDVLSKEAQSMLTDLAQDSSGITMQCICFFPLNRVMENC